MTGTLLGGAVLLLVILAARRQLKPDPKLPTGGPELEAILIQMCKRGEKLPAMLVYRQQTGTSLKEAKDAIERLSLRP